MRKPKTYNEEELLQSAGLSTNEKISKLSPLSPAYLPEEHGEYVVRLARALYENNCANVALAGPYGSGKSSILSKLQDAYPSRCITIGISTLAPKISNGRTAQNENGSASSPLKFDHREKEGLTNELEREIVGQLLYQGNPQKTPKSSFNRIHPTKAKIRIAKSITSGFAAVVLALVLIFCADNTSNKLATWIDYASSIGPCTLGLGALLTIALFSLIAYCIIPKNDGKVRVESVGAAGASLKLEEGSYSYFDQYLDEIVYFFEANEYDTVIFEDIDRFENPLIFEELRNLNALLNKVPGIKSGNRTVHFVYAVRDSIFEAAAIESTNERICADKLKGMVAGSGRVKFFDQIIPVIPFLSELNSFDMARKLFEHEILATTNSNEKGISRNASGLLRHYWPTCAF